MKSPSITRREAITALALGTAAVSAPFSACSNLSPSAGNGPRNPAFRYCLNTSTISGRESGLLQYINIAATAGLTGERSLDLFEAGEKYGSLLEPGRKTGVMPQLEFWGSSPVLWHLGQALMVASAASDADVNILPDIYHLFRGGSGFESLKMLNGTLVGIQSGSFLFFEAGMINPMINPTAKQIKSNNAIGIFAPQNHSFTLIMVVF